MKVLLLVLALLALAYAKVDTKTALGKFLEFQRTYSKTYAAKDLKEAFWAFQDNLELAERLSLENPHATFGVTKFMDLTPNAFRKYYLMVPMEMEKPDPKLLAPALEEVALPDSWDWRDHGAVTPVYNQGQCGSCWAFSASETVESYWFLKTKSLVKLSQQQIVDCDTTAYGCSGGWTYWAFAYLISAGGQDTLTSYPYVAVDQTCHFNKNTIGAKISAYNYVTQSRDENAMQQWAYANGPLSVCVDASSWSVYTGGVITSCGQGVDHCVVVTGFSTQSGIKAWNVRNSWGTDWGLSGYLYVERGQNMCAIATTVTAVTASP